MTVNRRDHDNWETVAVTALPAGWRNVYRLNDGTISADACPAILLQECRSSTVTWDEPTGDGGVRIRQRTERHDPPYATRAVAAYIECGELIEVSLVGNYVGTVGPDEDPSIYAPPPIADNPA